jgi:hypothetical protein
MSCLVASRGDCGFWGVTPHTWQHFTQTQQGWIDSLLLRKCTRDSIGLLSSYLQHLISTLEWNGN